MRIYDNQKGETFTRETATYGYTDKYDIERKTAAEMDAWLKSRGFYQVGVEHTR